MNLRGKNIHMIGIGGIGMSALAFVLTGMGYRVSGSDAEENDITKKMRKEGMEIYIGHDGSHVKSGTLVVFSSSIRETNPELSTAREKNLRIIPRIELLKMVMDGYKIRIGVTGTHGKTTITSMSSLLMEKAGFEPTVLIGGESPHFGGNAKFGKGDTLVAEVDESDGRFVMLRPTHLIVPNLEREHVEYYRDEAHLLSCFENFLNAQSEKMLFFYGMEDANLVTLASNYSGKSVSFGFSEKADMYATNLRIGSFRIDFDCFYRGKKLKNFTLNLPGTHNVLNSLSVIALGAELGIDDGVIRSAIGSYKNAKRRFEIVGNVKGAKIVEDYAHHPTEIKATISAALSLKPRRLITVFQPHRYTRTKSFYKEFSESFKGSNEVILAEVYSASEDRIKGVSSKSIYDIMAKDRSIPVSLMDKEEIPAYLCGKIKDGDIVLVLGAGDIGKTARRLAQIGKK